MTGRAQSPRRPLAANVGCAGYVDEHGDAIAAWRMMRTLVQRGAVIAAD